MAELLIKASNTGNGWERGMPICAFDDGHKWGSMETLPQFAVIKFPNVSKERLEKYSRQYLLNDSVFKRRIWQIRWADLPQAARNKLASTGSLTIKAVDSYNGAFDYTWSQVKTFFRNLETGLDEAEDL